MDSSGTPTKIYKKISAHKGYITLTYLRLLVRIIWWPFGLISLIYHRCHKSAPFLITHPIIFHHSPHAKKQKIILIIWKKSSQIKYIKRMSRIVDVKNFMLILLHLLCFFILKMARFESLTKRNCSQQITIISLSIT